MVKIKSRILPTKYDLGIKINSIVCLYDLWLGPLKDSVEWGGGAILVDSVSM